MADIIVADGSDAEVTVEAGTPSAEFYVSGALIGPQGNDGASFVWRGSWATATAYIKNDAVVQNGSSYIALTGHTSGTFAADLAANKWQLMAQKGTDGNGAGDMTKAVYDPANKNAQVAIDTEVVKKTGSTMTGPLQIKATGGAAIADLPLGRTGAVNTGIDLIGSFGGGEDSGSGTDTTARLNTYNYQRAQTGSFGEPVRHFLMRADAKAMNAWYMPSAGYDGSRVPIGTDYNPIAWIGAHYEANNHDAYHNHISIEVPDLTGALQTRFEVPFATWNSTNTIGIADSDAMVRVTNAKFIVGGGSPAILEGAAGTNRQLDFSTAADRASSGLTTNRRWSIQTDSTAEAGSSVGSDYRILRRGDTGIITETALFIKRSTGAVGIGNVTSPAAKLDVLESGSRHGVQATISTASGITYAAYSGILGLSTNKLFDGRVTADSTGRIAIYGDGKIEIGDGGAGGRDTNLYRSAANTLKTDDTFVAPNVTIGALDGVLKATAGVVSVATAGTDYAATVKQTLPKTSGGTVQYGIPGASFTTQNTSSFTANEVRYVPFVVKYPVTLTDQQFEVTTTPASNANVRVGIYAANTDMQPTGAPLYDAGVAVATGFTGVKSTTSMALSLAPGTYLIALNVDVAMTLRTIASPSQAISPSMGANAVIQRYTATQTYGAFPSTPTAWSTAGASTGSQQNSVFFKWTE